ncbi:MAG: copper chaperone PCu(A)C [Ardenticatenaceae bacterium]|nr:copper chaperone PCu(A)C [Ardenticatenaceae bacterium]
MNRFRVLLFVLLLLGLVVGCSSGTTTSGKMEVQDAWGRTSPMAAQNGAFYMNLVNNSSEDDALKSASTDACDVVELHEMYMMENDVMGMRPVQGGEIPVPSGQTVELKPGGLHVMCIGKTADFNVGDKYTLNLEFAKAGSMAVTVDIRETGEMPANMNMEGMNNNDGMGNMEQNGEDMGNMNSGNGG